MMTLLHPRALTPLRAAGLPPRPLRRGGDGRHAGGRLMSDRAMLMLRNPVPPLGKRVVVYSTFSLRTANELGIRGGKLGGCIC